MGDAVPFKLTSAVPYMDGYEKYFFVMTDTLSDGLTFNDDVVVKLDGTVLTKGTDYTVEQNGQVVTIVFKNFIQYKNDAGKAIEVTYTATLNENAAVGGAGNPNEVYLTYTNNPNVPSTGDSNNPDKPASSDPTGVTPTERTYTHTTGIKLLKVAAGTQNALTGAQFRASGERVESVLVNGTVYRASSSGVWWRLKDGTYTKTAPTQETVNSYEDTSQKYDKVEKVTKQTVTTPVETTGWVDQDGYVNFTGLAAGTYTISELTSPTGYNLLGQDIGCSRRRMRRNRWLWPARSRPIPPGCLPHSGRLAAGRAARELHARAAHTMSGRCYPSPRTFPHDQTESSPCLARTPRSSRAFFRTITASCTSL